MSWDEVFADGFYNQRGYICLEDGHVRRTRIKASGKRVYYKYCKHEDDNINRSDW